MRGWLTTFHCSKDAHCVPLADNAVSCRDEPWDGQNKLSKDGLPQSRLNTKGPTKVCCKSGCSHTTRPCSNGEEVKVVVPFITAGCDSQRCSAACLPDLQVQHGVNLQDCLARSSIADNMTSLQLSRGALQAESQMPVLVLAGDSVSCMAVPSIEVIVSLRATQSQHHAWLGF